MKPAQGQKLKNIKYNNYQAVFSILRQADNRSIGDIAREIRLSNTAVSKIINALLERGMVYSSGKGVSTNEGGKRPELFSANKDYKYAMVLQAETSKINCAIFDLRLNVRCKVCHEHIGNNMSYPEYLNICADVMKETVQKMQISPERLFGCCIASPGIIDSSEGVLVYPVWSPSWGKNLRFCADLGKLLSFELDLIIENNSRLLSYAQFAELTGESQHGSYVGITSSDDNECPTPGVGGCIFNGRIRRGMNGYAGEFGHITVDHSDDEICICGRKGCLQTVTAPRRIVNYAYARREEYPDSKLWEIERERKLLMQDVFSLSNQGDELCRKVIDIVVEYYARGIENIILTIDPENILLCGGFTSAGEYFLKQLNERIRKAGLFGSVNKLNIRYAKYDKDAVELKGPAMYLFDRYLNDVQSYVDVYD